MPTSDLQMLTMTTQMTTELIGKVGRDARLEAHVKSCHSDDGDNGDYSEYSDDDTDEVEDDDDVDAKVDWKKGRDAGWRRSHLEVFSFKDDEINILYPYI